MPLAGNPVSLAGLPAGVSHAKMDWSAALLGRDGDEWDPRVAG